jgi:ferredoxin
VLVDSSYRAKIGDFGMIQALNKATNSYVNATDPISVSASVCVRVGACVRACMRAYV